ncbi:MAG: hypothetical protein U5L95_02325 [Candidatus Saccharibacteria bacterium]|nr:hypothetical protein [Candidatus Saccharibacteria bacterium]
MKHVKIIGIGGLPRSGKDSLAEHFMKAGFFGVSLGDINREYTRERHAGKPDPISVENMTETSNWLRKEHGADFFLQEALRRYEAHDKPSEGLVLFSIRAPIEVDFILERGGELIWVEASAEVRHDRGRAHLRDGEVPISLEEFKRQEAKQWEPQPGQDSESQMNISYVKQKATLTFENNGNSFRAFHEQADELVKRLTGLQ